MWSFRQDRNGRRPTALVRQRQGRRVERRIDRSDRWRAPLDLGNHRDPGAPQPPREVDWSRPSKRRDLQFPGPAPKSRQGGAGGGK